MPIRTILAPGIEINEIDKSQYSPSMTGSNCYVMGLTEKGEPYQPMEFTSRAAWQNYYGVPTTEAERYAYAAMTEVLNQNGHLYFARLPYDNPATDKVVGFTYSLVMNENITANRLSTGQVDSKDNQVNRFWEINAVDSSISNAACIQPNKCVEMFDLSAIDQYRTDEARVRNNTFVITDITFNTYGKIMEDERKNNRREMVGIMPVITTAANAMHQQHLIDVARESVIGYESIGAIKTLDAASQISSDYPQLSTLTSNTVKSQDLARLINTKDYYTDVVLIDVRITDIIKISLSDYKENNTSAIYNSLLSSIYARQGHDWDGQYQISATLSSDLSTIASVSALVSYKRAFSAAEMSSNSDLSAEYYTSYKDKFGWHNAAGDDTVPNTVSQEANSFFPTIEFDGEHFDRTNMKKIGVVVYKMFIDPAEGNKINFEPVEAFAGSLCKTDRDLNTGATTFIDTIINSQSKYINFFSNCFNTAADKKYYADQLDILVVRPGAAHSETVSIEIEKIKDFPEVLERLYELANVNFSEVTQIENIKINTEILKYYLTEQESNINTLGDCKCELEYLGQLIKDTMLPDTVCPSLGFYSEMTKKTISIAKSIYDGMTRCFEKVEDINKLDIDIIPDAGLANIASYLNAIYGDKGEYDLAVTDDVGNSLLSMWRCDSNNTAIKTWKTVEQKLDNFCKNVRKDCMFIADGPRPFVLQGQKKIIRETKPTNTIDANIIPNIKWITGLNTSYGACYVDWFEQADDYSGDFFWCPPSIKAMGVYINCDVNFNYWDAPAGLNRGIIAATDVSFSPTIKQAGSFYEKNLNYAIQYPNEGIVLEGQKTLQTKPSAFDRVNVRRLFLRLERMVFKTARWFVYEGNTAYTRQRFIDALEPYFKQAMNQGGIYDYKIKCDESNNTPETIDNNELHVAIGIKPVKTIEFIMVDFTCLRTGGSWAEAGF